MDSKTVDQEKYEIPDGMHIEKIEVTFKTPEGETIKLETHDFVFARDSFFSVDTETEFVYPYTKFLNLDRRLTLHLEGRFNRGEHPVLSVKRVEG